MTDNEQYNTYRFFISQLRSPLTAIKGFTSLASTMLSDDKGDLEKTLEFVKRARSAAVRSQKMIDTFVETGEINHHRPPRAKRIKKRKK